MTTATHVVMMTRYFYGPSKKTEIAVRGTLAECKAWIADAESGICYLGHNESGNPSYRVRTISSLTENQKTYYVPFTEQATR